MKNPESSPVQESEQEKELTQAEKNAQAIKEVAAEAAAHFENIKKNKAEKEKQPKEVTIENIEFAEKLEAASKEASDYFADAIKGRAKDKDANFTDSYKGRMEAMKKNSEAGKFFDDVKTEKGKPYFSPKDFVDADIKRYENNLRGADMSNLTSQQKFYVEALARAQKVAGLMESAKIGDTPENKPESVKAATAFEEKDVSVLDIAKPAEAGDTTRDLKEAEPTKIETKQETKPAEEATEVLKKVETPEVKAEEWWQEGIKNAKIKTKEQFVSERELPVQKRMWQEAYDKAYSNLSQRQKERFDDMRFNPKVLLEAEAENLLAAGLSFSEIENIKHKFLSPKIKSVLSGDKAVSEDEFERLVKAKIQAKIDELKPLAKKEVEDLYEIKRSASINKFIKNEEQKLLAEKEEADRIKAKEEAKRAEMQAKIEEAQKISPAERLGYLSDLRNAWTDANKINRALIDEKKIKIEGKFLNGLIGEDRQKLDKLKQELSDKIVNIADKITGRNLKKEAVAKATEKGMTGRNLAWLTKEVEKIYEEQILKVEEATGKKVRVKKMPALDYALSTLQDELGEARPKGNEIKKSNIPAVQETPRVNSGAELKSLRDKEEIEKIGEGEKEALDKLSSGNKAFMTEAEEGLEPKTDEKIESQKEPETVQQKREKLFDAVWHGYVGSGTTEDAEYYKKIRDKTILSQQKGVTYEEALRNTITELIPDENSETETNEKPENEKPKIESAGIESVSSFTELDKFLGEKLVFIGTDGKEYDPEEIKGYVEDLRSFIREKDNNVTADSFESGSHILLNAKLARITRSDGLRDKVRDLLIEELKFAKDLK